MYRRNIFVCFSANVPKYIFFDVNFSVALVVCNNCSYLASSFDILFQFSSAKFCGVGLKDGRVSDEDITVSRTADNGYQKQFARLDRQGTNSHFGGWVGCYNPCGKRFSVFSTVSFASMKIKVQTQVSSNRMFQHIKINPNRTWIEPFFFSLSKKPEPLINALVNEPF